MTLEQAKQYHQIIAEELNVHNVGCGVLATDKGDLNLIYNKDTHDFHWELDKKDCTTPKLYELIPQVLDSIWSQL